MSNKLIWAKYNNITIRDVDPHWHPLICELMLENFYKIHPIYQVESMQELGATDEQFMNLAIHVLKSESCVIAIDEATLEISAVVLMSWMTEEWRSWRSMEVAVDKGMLFEFLSLCFNMMTEYDTAHPNHPFDTMHIFCYYIRDELRSNKEFMEKFFFGIKETARNMKMPRITMMAIRDGEKRDLRHVGYTEINRKFYILYEYRNKHPFIPLREIDEQYASLYELMLTPIIPYTSMVVHEVSAPKEIERHAKKETVEIVRHTMSASDM